MDKFKFKGVVTKVNPIFLGFGIKEVHIAAVEGTLDEGDTFDSNYSVVEEIISHIVIHRNGDITQPGCRDDYIVALSGGEEFLNLSVGAVMNVSNK